MPQEYYDLVQLFWSQETILNGRRADDTIVKKVLTKQQLEAIEDLQSKHDYEMQALLKRIAE